MGNMADIIVQETVASSSPIVGATSGAIGIAGIIKKPRSDGQVIKVNNWDDAVAKLGDFMTQSTVMYGLRDIFDKLGTAQVFVAPVTHRTTATDPATEVGKPASVTITDSNATPTSLIQAQTSFWGNVNYGVIITNVDATAKTFDVQLQKDGNNLGDLVKGVTVTTFASKVQHPDFNFVVLVGDDSLVPTAQTWALTGGVDAYTGVASADYDTALEKLKKFPLDFLIVDSTLTSNAQKACAVGDVIKAQAYLAPAVGATDADAKTFRASLNSKAGFIVHPHIKVADPLGSSTKSIPATYQSVANQILAWKAVGRRQVCAGIIYGSYNCLGLVSIPDANDLDSTGVNPIIQLEATDGQAGGFFLWDATTASNDPDWSDLNRVLLLNYVRKSIVPSLRPDLFKAGDPELYGKTKTRCEGFLEGVYKQGDFYGKGNGDAYYVQCDTNNNSDPNSKKMYVKVGYKDKKMVKWIVLNIEVA